MRVIAGSARRLNLVTPKGNTTRPTGDKIKETLFNILADKLYDVNFLDLFSGSGGIGIEALSRGACHCTFVEKDKNAVLCIKKNLETTHFTDRSTVLPYDVTTCLANIDSKGGFDIIFMDPPYDRDIEKAVLGMLAGSSLINSSTLIIVESSSGTDFGFCDELGFEVVRIKEYKSSKHVFIKQANNNDPGGDNEKSHLPRKL